ncbi:MAG: HU family DNA-binding protein [Proteobacteria bacterium]|nr:HU family DNA-binding protein [Pseudomonadota bacterium]
MNKNELIEAVAKATGGTKADVSRTIDAVFNAISGQLKKGQQVRLVNFGTFLVAKRKATEGRNPRTGAPIKIPASKQPKFRAGKLLKEAVNK